MIRAAILILAMILPVSASASVTHHFHHVRGLHSERADYRNWFADSYFDGGMHANRKLRVRRLRQPRHSGKAAAVSAAARPVLPPSRQYAGAAQRYPIRQQLTASEEMALALALHRCRAEFEEFIHQRGDHHER